MTITLKSTSVSFLATCAVTLLGWPLPRAAAQVTLEKPACSTDLISATDDKIGRMKDGPQKTTATTEIAAARQALSEGKTELCQDHLLKATLQTK